MYLQNTRHDYRQDLWILVILMWSKVQTDKIQNVVENSVHIIQKTNEIFGLENLLMSDCSYERGSKELC